ncbi:PRC-barrel domain-containing protein [Maritalea porphyrae]|uniref:PRC-barrel domain-containing protein n=1 Tax=Maritalea porphyrae TaxID=880732 RepID=A0ABQ5UMY6_9HYPH|nr:PRC-barrel domain-containing protein [Maritalea porphyrae]GLQ15938.1 hypothetical protein GCM10007879_01870 [Maritalea porphyrae]
MKKNLLTTTALFALLTSSAIADNNTVSTDLNSSTQTDVEVSSDNTNASSNLDVETSVSSEVETPSIATDSNGDAKIDNAVVTSSVSAAMASSTETKLTMSGQAVLASNLLGKKVYTSADADAKSVGDINDVVMDQNGNAEWVIVGVGGFLGMGEKEVALSIEQVDWVERDGERVVITNMTKAQLEAAAEFNRDALNDDDKYQPFQFSWTEEGKKRLDVLKSWDWEHSNMMQVAYEDLSADALIGTRVKDPNNDDIGEIGDVLLTEKGEVTAYIVDVGGFLGLGEKPVALSNSRIHIYQDADANLMVRSDFTKAELENSTTYDAEAYKADPDAYIIK